MDIPASAGSGRDAGGGCRARIEFGRGHYKGPQRLQSARRMFCLCVCHRVGGKKRVYYGVGVTVGVTLH